MRSWVPRPNVAPPGWTLILLSHSSASSSRNTWSASSQADILQDMPQLMTLEGPRYYFDVAALTAVADTDADTGDKVTPVYGLSLGRHRINGTPELFLQSVHATDTFVKLTRLDNRHVWLNAPAVGVIQSADSTEDGVSANCVIPLGGTRFAVKETLDEVRRLLNAHGSAL